MPIDKVELATELEKNPEIEKIATEALAKKGFVIRDKAADTVFLDNYKKDVIEKEIPKEIAKVHSQYDADIKTTFGIDRNQDEKSYDYLKRAGKTKIDELNVKIADLDKTIKEKGDPSGVLTKRLEKAEADARAAIEDREKQIGSLKQENEKSIKNVLLIGLYANLRSTFIKALPPMFERTSKGILDEVLGNSVVKDGVLYMGDGTGGIKKDSAFKEIKVEDYLKTDEAFKSVIDVKREQGGAGSGKGGGNGDQKIDPETITKETFIRPESVKTQGDLMDVMLAMGLQRGTAKFTEIWNKFALGTETITEGGKKIDKKIGEPLPLK